MEAQRRLGELASKQHGVFARRQALPLGITARAIESRVAGGRWQRVARGVYAMEGARPTLRRAMMVACLAWGEGAVVSHRAAATLWGLPGASVQVEISVPRGRDRREGAGVIVHRVRALERPDTATVDAIPVTAIARTLIDLATVVPANVLEEAVHDAIRRGLTTHARIARRLDALGSRGRSGAAAIRAVLDRVRGAVPESVLETRLTRLIRSARLPPHVLQHPLREDGRLIAVVDIAFPAQRIAVEADGYRWHSSRTRWARDLERRNALAARGWTVIHVTWDDVHARPRETVDRIRRVLANRYGANPRVGV